VLTFGGSSRSYHRTYIRKTFGLDFRMKSSQFLVVTKTFCSTYYLFYGPSFYLDVVCDSFDDLLYGGDTQVPCAGGATPRRSYFQQRIYNSKTTTVRFSSFCKFGISLRIIAHRRLKRRFICYNFTRIFGLVQPDRPWNRRRFWFKTFPSNRKICHVLGTVRKIGFM